MVAYFSSLRGYQASEVDSQSGKVSFYSHSCSLRTIIISKIKVTIIVIKIVVIIVKK